ncbi:uncharacterized protein LOC112350708 [Selaginella moellendorffii]|uniref:uncharacterized protein LOC112350708 n=1 Tax=Selaginella moellendorffii TaxID=88036 RepID=UPI000D1C686F|nr:uncharacterized protein LOC112350708 [Selaginella moellendorffii]|eukprot:XP_024543170.1 uncharacterized protein LOC112350708 [Selaginella moellendorffii]
MARSVGPLTGRWSGGAQCDAYSGGARCKFFSFFCRYAKKDDPESSNLWVEHRCEYQSPIEEQLYEQEYVRCPQGANIWRDVLKLDKIVQEDEEERALVQELNRQYQEQLAAEEAKKSKKKKLPEPAADAAQPPDPAVAATPQLVAPPVS